MRRPALLLALLLLTAAPLRAQLPTVVILVRHAEKDASDPADRDPALSEAGRVRALALWPVLRDAGIQSIVTTNLRRTGLTAQPTADSLHLTPEVVAASAATATETAALIRGLHAGQTVLVVGHSNTVPATIEALGGPRVTICDAQYSRLFVLVLRPGGAPALVQSSYGAADPPGAGDCASAPAMR